MNHRSVSQSPQEGDLDLTLNPEQEAFRTRVRAWLKANIPAEWQSLLAASADVPRPEAYDLLRR